MSKYGIMVLLLGGNMAKYRLSYLENGGYKAIDLSKLECLNEYNVTDINVIDKLTMMFRGYDDFIRFLIRNKIIKDDNIKLEITIDKKLSHNGSTYNKPIFNSDKLLFSSDEELLKYSNILKNIREHIYDSDYIYKLAVNYEEKYSNAYNRISGSSFILGIISIIKTTAIKLEKNGKNSLSFNELNEYEDAINDLYIIELYKYDTIKENNRTVDIIRKKDAYGKYIKNYRGLHDFINLLKHLDPELVKIEEDEPEEFLVLNEDFRRVNKEIVDNHVFQEEIYEIDKDYMRDFDSRQDMFAELQRDSRKYCLKKGDGERKYN